MSGKWYAGRTPDSDSVEVPKAFADSTIAAGLPSVTYVRNKIAQAISSVTLETPAYVNLANAQVAQKITVDTADQAYVATGQLNVAGGVAGLDSGGDLFTAQIPAGVPTEYTMASFDVFNNGIVYLTGPQTALTNSLRELKIASIQIADPGYPYRPIPMGIVQAGDPGGTQLSRTVGTTNYGLLVVMPPHVVSDQVYGAGICTDTTALNFYQFLPYAAAGATPTLVPPVQGDLELDLYGSCWTGTGYQFTPSGLTYSIFCFPAM